MNGNAVPPMDFNAPIQGPWPQRFNDNQIYLRANAMAIQLAFVAIPLMLGLVAIALMLFVPTTFGRTAGLIVGTAIFPSLGACWWLGRMMQPTHFLVYQGKITSIGTQDLFKQQRPTARVQIEAMHHLSAKGLHPVERKQPEINIPTPQTDYILEKDQDGFFVCLSTGELVAVFPITST